MENSISGYMADNLSTMPFTILSASTLFIPRSAGRILSDHSHGGGKLLIVGYVLLENAAMHSDAGDRIPYLVRQAGRHLAQQEKALLQVLILLRHLHMGQVFEESANPDLVIVFLQLRESKPDELAVSVSPRKFHLDARGKVVHGKRFA
jgi:hypothetical protein